MPNFVTNSFRSWPRLWHHTVADFLVRCCLQQQQQTLRGGTHRIRDKTRRRDWPDGRTPAVKGLSGQLPRTANPRPPGQFRLESFLVVARLRPEPCTIYRVIVARRCCLEVTRRPLFVWFHHISVGIIVVILSSVLTGFRAFSCVAFVPKLCCLAN